MADQEFQESEVMFSERYCQHDKGVKSGLFSWNREKMVVDLESCRRGKKKKHKKSTAAAASSSSSSLPVNIPSNVLRLRGGGDDDQYFEEEYDDGDELVPPHVIIGRRIFEGKMAFSVCTGNGRTLKGRDLSQVRNSILKLTGFLET